MTLVTLTKIFQKKLVKTFENRNHNFVPLQRQNKDERRRSHARKESPTCTKKFYHT